MDEQTWCIKEFERLHAEIKDRINFLHNTINLAIIFWMIVLVSVFTFMTANLGWELIKTFLLIFPIIINLIGFNYQSNQNSLESIAKYIHDVLRPKISKQLGKDVLTWDKYFADQKAPFKFESIFKIFPFILPSLIPFVMLVKEIPLNPLQYALSVIDIVLLIFLLENFRYKLRRVK